MSARLWLKTAPAVDVVAVIGLLSLAFSVEHLPWVKPEFMGLDPTAVHKLAILACTAAVFLRAGLRHWSNPVIMAATALLILSFTVSERLEGLTPSQSLQSYAAMILGVYLFELHLSGRIMRWLLMWMPWTAIINLTASILLGALTDYPYYRWFFGAFRLSGIGNPAILSAVALGAMLFSLLAGFRWSRWYWLAAVNYFIIVWTGTRTRIIEGAIVLLCWAVFLAVSAVKESRPAPKVQIALLLLAIPLAVISYGPYTQARLGNYAKGATRESISVSMTPGDWFPGGESDDEMETEEKESNGDDASAITITTTGRKRAWSYYWSVFDKSRWFGQGLGATVVVGTGELHPAFTLPHNEYLRLLVDGGIFGLGLMLLGHLLVIRRLLSATDAFLQRKMIIVAFGVLAVGSMVQNELTSLGFNLPFWLFVGVLSGELAPQEVSARGDSLREDINTFRGPVAE